MGHPFRSHLFFSLIVVLISASRAVAKTYVVQPGDTLSQIAADHIGRPVFTKSASLKVLMRINPQIKDRNEIFPGQSLSLPEGTTVQEALQAQPPVPFRGIAAEPIEAPRVPLRNETSAPCSAPAPPPVLPVTKGPETATNFDPYMTYGWAGGLTFERIDSMDRVHGGSAVIASKANPSVALNVAIHWSEQIATFASLDAVIDSYLNNDATTRELVDKNGSRVGFAAGVQQKHGNFAESLSLGVHERLFDYADATTTQIHLERVAIPSLHLDEEWTLFRVKRARAGVIGSIDLLGTGHGTGYDVSAGYGGAGGAFMGFSGRQFEFRASMMYSQIWQNSSIATMKTTSLGGGLQFDWKFGE